MQMAKIIPETTATGKAQQTGAAFMALHCSGADNSQWQHLTEVASLGTDLILPNLAGPEVIFQGW